MKNIHLSLLCILLTLFTIGFVPDSWSQICSNAASDPDNDGWGWEAGESCIMRTIDTDPCIDHDGDGWGWREIQRVSCQVAVPAETTTPVASAPDDQSGRPSVAQPPSASPYPTRDPFSIKAVYTDFWPNRNELLNANIGGVSVNLVWAHWEPEQQAPPCRANTFSYQNRCYQLSQQADDQIKYWSRQGKNVTAIIWGVPVWARDEHCVSTLSDRSLFCSTAGASHFGQFAGMLANRYSAANSSGFIDDYVIHNEVNMFEWYNHRCSAGQTCQLQPWIDNYANNFNAAYDRIKAENSAAKIFVPFAHQFASQFDNLQADRPLISVQSFVRQFNARTADRQWKIAYHPYNKGLHVNGFSTNDWPHVTMGNIGVIAGWLRTEFPQKPWSWEIYLTESGYNSAGPNASQQGQANDLCRSFYNVLATPGIENYVYHRMQDHTVELNAGIALGLHNQNGNAKPAWNVWSTASGRNGNRSQLACGFENLPYTKVTTYTHPQLASRTSSRLVDAQYTSQSSWWLMRNHVSNAVTVHECTYATGSYLTLDASCQGQVSLGPVGYALRNHDTGRRALYSCERSNGDRFASDNEQCDNQGRQLEFLGYATDRR